MEKYSFKVELSDIKKRLDLFLALKIPKETSRTHIQKLIGEGHVFVNGKPEKNNYRLRENDLIEIDFAEAPSMSAAAENIPIKIVYEDDDIIIVDKPVGMVTHPGAGNPSGTLVNAILYYTKNLSNKETVRPGIVHRLDKETSGLMVIAKNDTAHRKIAKQFKKRSVVRKYVAIVKGEVEQDNGIIEAPIGRHPRARKKMAVRFSDSKEAITKYAVVKRYNGFTLLELTPETGRTHQLRIHMAHIGHPIIGDISYGVEMGFPRQALHASALGFDHPKTGEYVEFKSPIPKDMKNFLLSLRS